MKNKNNLINVSMLGGLFSVLFISFLWVIYLKDDKVNDYLSMWNIKSLFINVSYADDDENDNDDDDDYKKTRYKEYDNDDYKKSKYKNSNTSYNYNTSNQEKSIISDIKSNNSNKVVELTSDEIKNNNERFLKVTNIIDDKYNTDAEKLDIYKKLNTLLNKKIFVLEWIKSYITNIDLLEKYEKKILLFKNLNDLTQEKILLYIDWIDLNLSTTIIKEKALNTKKIILEKAAADRAVAASRLAAQKAAADRAVAASRLAAQKAAADRAAAASRLAAQKAAAARANTNTSAS